MSSPSASTEAADSPLRRMLTQRFYRLFGSLGETRLPEGAGDFRLLDAQAVAALRTYARARPVFQRALCLDRF